MQQATCKVMVKVKGKAKGILQEIAEATASDSKPSDYSNPDVLQKEESSVPLSKVDTESSTGIEKFAEPSAKRAKLHQQLATVERQVHSSCCTAYRHLKDTLSYDTVLYAVDH